MIKLSVLVTFYNQEQYVDRTLKSIFDQKVNFEYEVIVGDDGSSDGTIKKIEEWQKKYPGKIEVYIQPREDRKYLSGERASCNRISLLKHVKGEYFMYLDGDDSYCDNLKFQKQVDILDSNSDCSCCAHNVSFVHLDGKETILKTWFKNTKKINFSYYWWKGYFHPDSLMFRSSNIEQKEKYEHPLFFNDNYITYVFAHNGKIYFLSDVMACYYETENGIWNGQSKLIGWIRTVTIYEYLQNLYKENRIVNWLRIVPLYHLILKHSDECSKEKIEPYIRIAKKYKTPKIARLQGNNKLTLKAMRLGYDCLYYLNAFVKRLF